MAKTLSGLSLIILILSLILFIFPAIIKDFLIGFFVVSFIFLIIAFLTSIIGLKNKEGEYSELSLVTLIISIGFLLFLIIGALLV